MSTPTLRGQILEIKSRPTTADIGVKALVKRLKPEFGDEVHAKSVQQHIEELERIGALQSAPAQDTVVIAVSESMIEETYEMNSCLLLLHTQSY
jgi:hypothetical protein